MADMALHPRLEALLGQRAGWRDDLDRPLMVSVLMILGIGLVMVASASVAVSGADGGGSLDLLWRQTLYLLPAGVALLVALRMPLDVLEALSPLLLLFGFFLLLLVLVPGVGREVNGATRWIPVGPVNVQAAEVARLCLLVYFAAFLQRHATVLKGSLRPLLPAGLVFAATAGLLLAQPDFGALVVLTITLATIFFIAGMPLLPFLGIAAAGAGLLTYLIVSKPYRLERMTAFRDPWSDPFDTGFQLTQSLIAVGRGEWTGVGLGNSVQKLFYLPEAHTDFLFAVLAEELGVMGMTVVIGLFSVLVWRACRIGSASIRDGNLFGGLLAFGIGVAIALQAFVNMGVNLGLLPTKGLTLPLMSYGGSSLVMTLAAIGVLLRVELERRQAARSATVRHAGGWS
ncbi:putative lipid II flippase FtsW [Spiribacter pallidus]|uniref:Probable peptidoglycan glycosyltransferase FtsW n=1 Tax=Spiribacter pallidus TaxID=1987936 RepID=A0ABV3TA82_9GAMM